MGGASRPWSATRREGDPEQCSRGITSGGIGRGAGVGGGGDGLELMPTARPRPLPSGQTRAQLNVCSPDNAGFSSGIQRAG